MNKILFKFGGLRVGDCLHSIPLLKAMQDKGLTVDMVCGFYESGAAKLLKYLDLVDTLYIDEFVDDVDGIQPGVISSNINGDMNSIKKFLVHIDNKYDSKYDIIIKPEDIEGSLTGIYISTKDIGIDLVTVPWACNNIPDIIVGNYVRTENYIGIQPSSISRFKVYNTLYDIEYPGDVKSFGFNGDRPILNSIKIHGKCLIDVYEELKTCSLVISTHSSIGILAYYLGIPQIFIHFWKSGLANLSPRENIIQLYEPVKSEIEDAIDIMWEKLNKKELVYG